MKILKCEKCGNLIEIIDEHNKKVVCCGEDMKELVINSSEASGEKHLPIYEIIGRKINVSVGSTLHPMEDNHNIAWIALVSENKTIKKYLAPGSSPVVKFPYISGSTIYAYCGVHGLFKTDVN